MSTQEMEQVRQEILTELRHSKAEYMRHYRKTHPEYVERSTAKQRAKRQALRAQNSQLTDRKAGEANADD